MKDALIPFDIQRAISGDKVVTRDGREVTEIVHFKTGKGDFPVEAVINGLIEKFTSAGNFSAVGIKNQYDLFMAPKPVEVFVSIYPDDSTGLLRGSLQQAKVNAGSNIQSICKISILNGEVIAHETVHKY